LAFILGKILYKNVKAGNAEIAAKSDQRQASEIENPKSKIENPKLIEAAPDSEMVFWRSS